MPGYSHCEVHSRGVHLNRCMIGRHIPLQSNMGKRAVDHSEVRGQDVLLRPYTSNVRNSSATSDPRDLPDIDLGVPGVKRVEPHGATLVPSRTNLSRV